MDRTRLLPDQVSIALAVDDLDTARDAAAELAESAQVYGSKALLAAAECARGELALATGQDDPLPSLRRGVALWGEAAAPYERGRAEYYWPPHWTERANLKRPDWSWQAPMPASTASALGLTPKPLRSGWPRASRHTPATQGCAGYPSKYGQVNGGNAVAGQRPSVAAKHT